MNGYGDLNGESGFILIKPWICKIMIGLQAWLAKTIMTNRIAFL